MNAKKYVHVYLLNLKYLTLRLNHLGASVGLLHVYPYNYRSTKYYVCYAKNENRLEPTICGCKQLYTFSRCC